MILTQCFFIENFITKKTFMGTFRMNYVNQIWLRESHEVNFVSRSYFATRMASAPTAMLLLLLLLIKSNCLKIQLDWQKLEKSKLTKEKMMHWVQPLPDKFNQDAFLSNWTNCPVWLPGNKSTTRDGKLGQNENYSLVK